MTTTLMNVAIPRPHHAIAIARRLMAALGILLASHTPMLASQSPTRVITIPAAEDTMRASAPLGAATVLADGRLAIVSDRLSLIEPASGALHEIPIASTAFVPDPTLMVQLADQTLVAWSSEARWLQRFDLDGRLLWKIRTGFADTDPKSHDIAAVNNAIIIARRQGQAGNTMIDLELIDNQGEERWQHRIDIGRSGARVELLSDQTRNRIYVIVPIGSRDDHPSIQATGIHALDLHGNPLWQWSTDPSQQGTAAAVRIRDSGELDLAFGGGMQTLSANGQASTFRPLSGSPSASADWAAFDGDSWYALERISAGDASSYRLSRVDASANVLWTRELSVAGSLATATPALMRVDGDGRLLLALAGMPTHLLGIDRAGNELFRSAYDASQGQIEIQFLLPMAPDRFAFGHDLPVSGEARHGFVGLLATDGTALDSLAIAGERLVPEQPTIATFDADGTAYLAIPGTAQTAARRIRVSADGGTAWSVDLPAAFITPRTVAICGDDAVCIAAAPDNSEASNGSRLARFDGRQADARWQHVVAGQPEPDLRWIDSRLSATHSGDVVLIDDYADISTPSHGVVTHRAHRITRTSRDGQIRFVDDTFASGANGQPAVQVAAAADGSLAFLSADTTGQVFALQPDGTRYTVGLAIGSPTWINTLGRSQSMGLVLDDGSVGYARFRVTGGLGFWRGGDIHWLLTGAGNSHVDTLLSARWDQGLGAPMLPIQQVRAHPSGDVLVLLHLSADEGAGRGVTELHRIDRAGAIRWRAIWEPEAGRDIQWFTDSAGNSVLSTVRDSGIWILRLVSSDGALLGQREIDCGGATCRIDAIRLDDNGTVTAAGRRHQSGIGPVYQIIQLPDMLPAPTPETIVARRRDGAWYSPGTDGQGMTLRLLPQADGRITVFMPWFTFLRYGEDDAAQDWLLLQGDIAPDQHTAELTMFTSGSGEFPGPGGDLDSIGSATLRMTSCDRALLTYHFNDDWVPRRTGSVALQPLLPALTECSPGNNRNPYGTDLANALSGLWHEPNRDGHGIDLHYLASSDGSSDVLFGAWYTYPAAPEATERRWLTLQSPRRDQNTVRAVIYDTTGGSFDNHPTANHARVGEVELESLGCDRLQLTYHFDDQPQAGNYRGRSGQLDLHRIGDCIEWPAASDSH